MPLVFMYGPDTVQGRMFDRVGASEVRGGAILGGYRLAFDKPNLKDKREGLPNLRADDGAEVFGVVFDLKPKQLELLDGFFGGYEKRMVRPLLFAPEEAPPAGAEGDDEAPSPRSDAPRAESTPVTATAWIARRTGRDLRPSAAAVEAARAGMEENRAPPRFIEALKEVDTLPSETNELMVQFERGLPEADARAVVSGAGGTVRRRMRTDHEDEVLLLTQFPAEALAAAERALRSHARVTLVERNSSDYRAL